MVDKATLSKGSASHAANHVIVPRNRSNFIRLLDFVSWFTKIISSVLNLLLVNECLTRFSEVIELIRYDLSMI